MKLAIFTLISIVQAVNSDKMCPGAPEIGPHAKTNVLTSITNRGCYNVHDEIYARVEGEESWTDPHGGNYKLLGESGTLTTGYILNIEHSTSEWTDRLNLLLTMEGDMGCKI